jgi:hypothetical protein
VCEVDRDDWRSRAALRAGCAQMVMATVFVPGASRLDRMDTGFDQTEAAGQGVAQALVSLRRSLLEDGGWNCEDLRNARVFR